MFEPATCLNCGEDYQRNLKHRPSRFCSRKCQSHALYLRKQAERGVIRHERPCKGCGEVITAAQRTDAVYCSEKCRAWASHVKYRDIRRVTNHGITVEDYAAILAAQGGTCAMPGCSATESRSGRALHIDHDHDCCPGHDSCGRCIRGLLCDTHNVGLGMFNDNPDALRAAADYLESRRLRVVAS